MFLFFAMEWADYGNLKKWFAVASFKNPPPYLFPLEKCTAVPSHLAAKNGRPQIQ